MGLSCTDTLISFDSTPALRIDGFTLEDDQRVAVIGPSGAGKSTLAAYFGGFLPDNAKVDGSATVPASTGVVPQEAFGTLNPLWRILAQVKLTASTEETARQLLRDVGLPDELHHRYPLQLSGGQRQRVSLALALATDPELLITDEVTSALDTTTTNKVLDMLRSLSGPGTGRTLLFLSHDMDAVRSLCDMTIVVEPHRDGPSTIRWEKTA